MLTSTGGKCGAGVVVQLLYVTCCDVLMCCFRQGEL